MAGSVCLGTLAAGCGSGGSSIPAEIRDTVATYVSTTGLTRPLGVPDYFLLSTPAECPTPSPQVQHVDRGGDSWLGSERALHGTLCIITARSEIGPETATIILSFAPPSEAWQLVLERADGNWQVIEAQSLGT